MELIWMGWCIFGLIMGFVCCHLAYKGTEDEGMDQRQLHDADNRDILPAGDPDMDHSDVGDLHGQEHSRCDMGQGCYKRGCITSGAATDALRSIRREMFLNLSNMEKDAIDYGIECIEVRAELMRIIEEGRNS